MTDPHTLPIEAKAPLAERKAGEIRHATTQAQDAYQAAFEIFQQLYAPELAGVLVFCSSHYDLETLATSLTRFFGSVPVLGCTSSGELTPFGHQDGTVTGVALPARDFSLLSHRFDQVIDLDIAETKPLVRTLLARADRNAQGLGPDARHAAIFLIDGLCMREEVMASAIHDGLGDVPLVGGSTGDDLAFKETFILHDGRWHKGAALLVLLTTRRPFRVFRNQHFRPSDRKMVVTEADPARRIVTEINAEPAAREYARLVGLEGETLTPMSFAAHPVMVRAGGEYFVRAIQKVNEDDSLTFFCAIDEGIVLTVAEGIEITQNLEALFADLRQEIGAPDLVLGFECVLRYLEVQQRQLKPTIVPLFANNNVVGFCTYGELFNASHVNQTFTGLAFGAAA
jgi:hypothetical protein